MRVKAQDAQIWAESAQINAEQVCETLNRTIASLRKQLIQEREAMAAK